MAREQIAKLARAQREESNTLNVGLQKLAQAIVHQRDLSQAVHGSQTAILQDMHAEQPSAIKDENERTRCQIIEAITVSHPRHWSQYRRVYSNQ